MTPLAVGTDTGGSIRVPASLCGIAGLKPTTGAIPNNGVHQLSKTFDCVGPLARNVDDLELMLEAMRGGRPAMSEPNDDVLRLGDFKVGVVAGSTGPHVSVDVASVFMSHMQTLADVGLRVVEIEFPGWDEVEEVFSCIARYEIAHRHREMGSLLSDDINNLLEEGLAISEDAYQAALQARDRVLADCQVLFRDIAFVAAPTTPIIAPTMGTDTVDWTDGAVEPLFDALSRMCYPANLVGYPAVTIPCGLVDHLPVGMQLIGPRTKDHELLRFGRQVEEALK
jgi:aspartyl-tRNA(Asn)/glutamyl-tRNA(Gln) amidotransferase subunit A